MASAQVVSLLLILLFVAARAQQKQPNLIQLGSSLSPNSEPPAWFSPSRIFAFGFYRRGNGFAVGIWMTSKSENTVVWTANRDDPPVTSNSTLEFTSSGNLTLRTELGVENPIAILEFPAVSASMLDSGNFIIYSGSRVVWQSFDYPTDTILGGQKLGRGDKLISSKSTSDHSSGQFFIKMQTDGNLVTYVKSTGEYYWATQTNDGRSLELNLSSTGSLYLSDDGLNIVMFLANSSFSVKKTTIIHRATLDADGNFRLYTHQFGIDGSSKVSLEWSAMQNQCEVKGACGLNSFCSGNSTKAKCDCFPGFLFINPDMKLLGCYATFNDEEGCRRNEPEIFHNITGWDNLTLKDYPYAVLPMNKNDCSKSCLEDCNCGAAIYLNGNCSKLKHPLGYAIKENVSSTVFIKNPLEKLPPAGNQIPSIPRNPRVVTDSKKKLILILAASLGSIAFLCSLAVISSAFVYVHRVHRRKRLSENSNLGLPQEFTLQSFSYKELEKATDGFKEPLGRSSFGAVYKGTVSEGNKVVAVKRLENIFREGEREFRAEMTAIAQTHHRNLVRLLGFCMEGARKLLVYEYMRNGSLADLLFDIERRPIWKERVRIALDVARGILYLHEECASQIIHCDIKPQNILMDDSWTAKISEFGLAKLLMPNQSGTITGVRGSRGYLAPEWQTNSLITVKADVYSFGVVLMEIVCCRSNMEVNVSTADEVLLTTWVHNCFVAGELWRLIEDEEVDMKVLERMVKIGLLCVQGDPSLRPSMKNVILMLEWTMDVPLPPSQTP